jgi:hypothetical protein
MYLAFIVPTDDGGNRYVKELGCLFGGIELHDRHLTRSYHRSGERASRKNKKKQIINRL